MVTGRTHENLNPDYSKSLGLIEYIDEIVIPQNQDHQICIGDKDGYTLNCGTIAPSILESITTGKRVGHQCFMYCATSKAKEDFISNINDNRSGFRPFNYKGIPGVKYSYIYNIPGNRNAMIEITEDENNPLNLVATRVSSEKIIREIDSDMIRLNETLGDPVGLREFASYNNRVSSIKRKYGLNGCLWVEVVELDKQEH